MRIYRLVCWAIVCSAACLLAPGCSNISSLVNLTAETRTASPMSLSIAATDPDRAVPAERVTDEDYEKLLGKFVDSDGRVDYEQFKKEQEKDEQFRRKLDLWLVAADDRLKRIGEDKRLRTAFYINFYNAAVMRAVLEFYPFDRLGDLDVDFYSDVLIPLAGEELSLSQLAERCDIAGDWRVRFALYEPIVSGGPCLQKELYSAKQLDKQLDRVLAEHIGSCAGLRIDHVARRLLFGKHIYRIRDMFIAEYRQKYGLDRPGSLVSAIMPYVSVHTQEQLADLVGYDVALLVDDDRLEDDQDNRPDQSDLPCGRH